MPVRRALPVMLVLGLTLAALFAGGWWVVAGPATAGGPAPLSADAGAALPMSPGLLPSEIAAPLDDEHVQALLELTRRSALPGLEAKALLAPHARDPGHAPPTSALGQKVLGGDDRVMNVLFPCRANCKGLDRAALSLEALCPAGARWLRDPGRQMARFEACENDDVLVVRPDGPQGAVVVLRETGLPAIFRDLVSALGEADSGLNQGRLDVNTVRRAVERGTNDKRVGQQLVSQLHQPLEGKDRRGDRFVITPVVQVEGKPAGEGLCWLRLQVWPGYKMSAAAWPRRYFADAAVLFVDERLPPEAHRLVAGKDLSVTLEVRAAACR